MVRGTQPVARIIYSRPQKKGRVIFGELVPLWQDLANGVPIKVLNSICTRRFPLAGQKLASGSYTLYTIPGEKEWTIIVNSKLYTWGDYDYDASKDVLRFQVTTEQLDNEQESFGIAFAGKEGSGRLMMAWDRTAIYIDFGY